MPRFIEISLTDGVQTIQFLRPDKKNAITAKMYEAMSAALDEGETNPKIKVHLFLGSNGVFTTGNDIKDFVAFAQSTASLAKVSSVSAMSPTPSPPDQAPPPLPALEFVRRLPNITKPMIAAVDGLAVGVGTTLLLHCDLVYASPNAVFATPFLDLGLVPEAGSSLLALGMGYQRAFEMLCLGEAFDAERAMQAGLINAIVPAHDLETRAMQAAKRLVARPQQALKAARALMRSHTREAICAKIEEEALIFAAQLKSPEAKEAFTAFFEKRPPNFAKAAHEAAHQDNDPG